MKILLVVALNFRKHLKPFQAESAKSCINGVKYFCCKTNPMDEPKSSGSSQIQLCPWTGGDWGVLVMSMVIAGVIMSLLVVGGPAHSS